MEVKSTIRFYNTYKREIEDFIPLEESKVKLYCCGPTVYDYSHIGHIRKYMFDDVLVRMLRYLAYDVTHVMNITDVGHLTSDADTGEDKLQKKATTEGKTAWEIAKYYESYFFDVMGKMNILKPSIVCRATEHINDQIELIKKLESKGFTYKIDDGIYFDISKFPDYNKYTTVDASNTVSRVEEIVGKRHPTDFALWKFSYSGGRSFDFAADDAKKKRHMEWDSPWGIGFPGWHIECSAMSMKYLGDTLDIHTAGFDHISIHSPNEIAQSEGATGKTFVRYWIHNNFLNVENEKMSKSKGDFIKLEDVIGKGFSPMALRYLFLQTHYRQQSNFTWDALQAAQTAINQLNNLVSVIKSQVSQPERSILSNEKLDKVNNLRKKFKDVIRYDLNTPQALGILWEIVKSNIPPGDKYDLLMIGDEILGLNFKNITGDEGKLGKIPQEIVELAQKREKLRHENLWQDADLVRKEISDKGYTVEDSSNGPIVKLK